MRIVLAAIACAILLAMAFPIVSATETLPFSITLFPTSAQVEPPHSGGLTFIDRIDTGHLFSTGFEAAARGAIDATFLNITGPRDLVFWLDGGFVQEVALEGLSNATAPSYNLTSANGTAFELTLPPGNHTLRIQLDRTPPIPELVDIAAITHNSALVKTRTDEPTLAALVLSSSARVVPFSTPRPAYDHTFPLAGLEPDMDYSFSVTFEDYSGNRAALGPYTFRSNPAPVKPVPTLRLIEPQNGTRFATPVERIVATVEDQNSTILTLTVFVDKEPITVELKDGRIEHQLIKPLGPGTHTLTIEAGNELGGVATERSKFTVEGRQTENAEAFLVLACVMLLALVRRRS